MFIKFKNSGSLFILLLIVFLPLPIPNFHITETITKFLFQNCIQHLSRLFSIEMILDDFSSDSVSLFLLTAIFCCISLCILPVRKDLQKLHITVQTISCYYLILILLSYGFNKVFGYQFPAPEANILFSRFGFLEKDILYWSVLGLSPLYTISTGLIECLIALLLLFNRTRLLGLIMALCSFLYILLINLSFDISVKLYTSLLVTITTYQLLFYKKELLFFYNTVFKPTLLIISFRTALKLFVFMLFIVIIGIPYILNLKSDEVFSASFKLEKTECSIDSGVGFPFVKMLFLKQGYVVFETADGRMTDYKIVYFNDQLVLERESQRSSFEVIRHNTHGLVLTNGDCKYFLSKIALDSLPVFQHNNHLFIDYIR